MTTKNTSFEDFYRGFEDRFRGPKELILDRLAIYLPLIDTIDQRHNNSRRAVDLGSGRGEWVELISQNGWQAIGVDPNTSMASAAQEIGIETIQQDALSFLKQQNDHSFGLVTAFHVVEHVTMEYLLNLLTEIYRVLIPDGIAILETPNPESLTVASWSFYLDPTHVRPIPPPLLQYHLQQTGFEAAGVLRLNGDNRSMGSEPLTKILSVLFKQSLDYAVIAQKNPTARECEVEKFIVENTQLSPTDMTSLFSVSEESKHVWENFERNFDKLEQLERRIEEEVLQLRHEITVIKSSTLWKIAHPFQSIKRFIGM